MGSRPFASARDGVGGRQDLRCQLNGLIAIEININKTPGWITEHDANIYIAGEHSLDIRVRVPLRLPRFANGHLGFCLDGHWHESEIEQAVGGVFDW